MWRYGLQMGVRRRIRRIAPPILFDGREALRLLAVDKPVATGVVRLRRTSRSAFGWVSTSPTRQWEYPWVIQQVARLGAGRTRTAADFGAGKSPVPIELRKMGFTTSVVDPGVLGTKYGNEWDFVDYRQWGIETHIASMEEPVFEPSSLGVAVSVSVIEHVSAVVRRRALEELARVLEPDGLLVLTIDMIHGPDRHLWNRVVDEIEPIEVHGTVDGFLDEARANGFQLRSMVPCPVEAGQTAVLGLVFRRLP